MVGLKKIMLCAQLILVCGLDKSPARYAASNWRSTRGVDYKSIQLSSPRLCGAEAFLIVEVIEYVNPPGPGLFGGLYINILGVGEWSQTS